jgi:c(7)-type cytochrome triheme protein
MKRLSMRLLKQSNCRYVWLIFPALLLAACNTTQKPVTPEPAPIETTPAEVTAFIKSAITANDKKTSDIEKPATPQSKGETVLATGKILNAVEMSASESPRNDGIHDTVNDAIVVLQNPAAAMKDFPRDRRHQVDWVQALAQGHIEPRADLLGKEKMAVLDLDILMKNTQFMPWVKFPHNRHTQWLACSNCHPAIFEAKEHANPISMNKVLRGEYCGVCHDKVAFALFTCERCHSVTHEGSGPKWW